MRLPSLVGLVGTLTPFSLILSVRVSCFGPLPKRHARLAYRRYSLLGTQSDSSYDESECSNPLPVNVEEGRVELDTGIRAQVFYGRPKQRTKLPPLAFIHGSFHAGWCWTERFFPYFMDLGYPVVSLSLRGTGSSFAGEGVKKVTIDQHASDVKSFLDQLPDIMGSSDIKPVLISHSFGGLAVMKLLESNPEKASSLAGIVVMCSVPPSGNGKMTLRFLRRSLVDSWKITAGFAMKRCIQNDALCRDLFFGGPKITRIDGTIEDFGVSDDAINRYQGYFKRDTEATIDIRDLLKHLPSKMAVDGMAPNVESFPPCLVVGAERDFLVDREGNEETARYFGLEEATYVDSPHDVMLGKNWKNAANLIDNWVQQNVAKK